MKIESKEKLAKLLAVEDLDVQHQQVETAYFDIKNRCLILPIWKDMPDGMVNEGLRDWTTGVVLLNLNVQQCQLKVLIKSIQAPTL